MADINSYGLALRRFAEKHNGRDFSLLSEEEKALLMEYARHARKYCALVFPSSELISRWENDKNAPQMLVEIRFAANTPTTEEMEAFYHDKTTLS